VVHGPFKSFGASITVETKIGAGTTFRVFFPAVFLVNTAGDAMAADA
jgi:hypothetical protein